MSHVIKNFIFLLLFFVSIDSFSKVKLKAISVSDSKIATKHECKMSRWPYSRSLTKKEFQKFAELIDRKILTHYFFYEVTKSNTSELATLLRNYMYATEPNDNLKGFFGAVAEAAELKTGKIKKLDSNELCEVYRTTLNLY